MVLTAAALLIAVLPQGGVGLDPLRAAVAEHGRLDARIAEIEARRREVNRALHANLLGRADEARLGGRRGKARERAELRRESFALRQELDRARVERAECGARIAECADDDAARWLRRNVQGKPRRGLLLRLAAARAIAGADPGGLVAEAVAARGEDDVLVALAALRDVAREAGDVLGRLVALRDHASPAVRELLGRVLAASRRPFAVEPLIDVLDRAVGEARRRLAGQLAGLTGQAFGDHVGSWRAWYADVRDRLLAGGLRLGGHRVAPQRPRSGGTSTYMGIPQLGRSIAYVLDASNSMKVAIDFELPGTSASDEVTRLAACKAELVRAIRALSPEVEFAIVYLHETAGVFRDRPVPATPDNVRAAVEWIEAVEPALMTNVYDGVVEAYAMLGQGIDTVFLLSDGAPVILDPTASGQRGVGDPIEHLVRALADLDPFGLVSLHCIGIGKGVRRRLLQELAAARGGIARFL